MSIKTNWQQVIKEINSAGVTYEYIGKQCGVAKSTIGDIATGRTVAPVGDAALLLMKLHFECVPAKKKASHPWRAFIPGQYKYQPPQIPHGAIKKR